MSAAGLPPSWNGSTLLVIGVQIQTEGCPVKFTKQAAPKQDGEESEAAKGTGS